MVSAGEFQDRMPPTRPLDEFRSRLVGHLVQRADALADGEHNRATISCVVELPDAVTISDHLPEALTALESTPGAVPVLDDSGADVVGWLSHQRVLRLLHASRDDRRMPVS